MKRLNINSTVQIPATKDVLTFLRSENTQFWHDYIQENKNNPDIVAFAKNVLVNIKIQRLKMG